MCLNNEYVPEGASHFFVNSKGKKSYYRLAEQDVVFCYNKGSNTWDLNTVINPNSLTPITTKCTNSCAQVSISDKLPCSITIQNIPSMYDLNELISKYTPKQMTVITEYIENEQNLIIEYNHDSKTWTYVSIGRIQPLGTICLQSLSCATNLVKFLNQNSVTPSQIKVN